MKLDPDLDQLFRLPGGLTRVAEGCEAVKPRGRAGNLGGVGEREGRRELRAGERDASRPAGDRDGGEQPEHPVEHALNLLRSAPEASRWCGPREAFAPGPSEPWCWRFPGEPEEKSMTVVETAFAEGEVA